MSDPKPATIPILKRSSKPGQSFAPSVKTLADPVTANSPGSSSTWQRFKDSIPIIGTTDGERSDTGERTNPLTRFGAGVALTGLSMVLNQLTTTKYDKAVDFLKHYVSGRGQPYELDVPLDWQKAIISRYTKKGIYKNVSPYNWGMKDLQNSLGHFDLSVVKNDDGSLTYNITDEYKFPAPKNFRERHGFQFPGITEDRARIVRKYLPSDEYITAKGFKEKWELKKINGEWTLFIPQPFLDNYGVNFKVSGSFTVPGPNRLR